MLDDLPYLGQSVVTSGKREAIAKNVTECPTTSLQQLAQQVGLSHTHRHTVHVIPQPTLQNFNST